MIIENHFSGGLVHFQLSADFLDLRNLLFELSGKGRNSGFQSWPGAEPVAGSSRKSAD
jgi:hypothetical protein